MSDGTNTMDVNSTQAIAYVGAGGLVGGGLAAVRHGVHPLPVALGLTTGLIAGGVQTAVQSSTGSSELGWGAAFGSGTVAGAVLLGGLAHEGTTPFRARAVGAGIGAATGLFAPIAASIVLAQLQN